MKIVSIAEMKKIEEEANQAGYTYAEMMEDAGDGMATLVDSLWGAEDSEMAVIGLVGSGNNGGDTLIALESLQRKGWNCMAYLVRTRPVQDPLLVRIKDAGCSVITLEKDVNFRQLNVWLENADILLDGILGTGASLPLKKDILAVLVNIHKQPRIPFTIAVDCPSGVNCDTGEAAKETLHAELTLCMGAVKQGLLKLPAFEFAHDIGVLRMDFDENSATLRKINTHMADDFIVDKAFPPRQLDAHKGTFGTLLIAAGSVNYPGAAMLAGKAAYRCGVGLVQMAVPTSIHAALAGSLPEATWLLLPHEMGVIAGEGAGVIWQNLERATAMVLGPGWGTENTTREFLKQVLMGEESGKERAPIGFVAPGGKAGKKKKSSLPPVVIDADGLRLLTNLPNWPSLLPSVCVLTPHPGEMSALTGLSVAEIQADRIEITRKYAREWKCVVVLKGAFSVIGEPGGKCTVVPHAEPALATAGTGDVLSGMIGSLLAQGQPAGTAAIAAVLLHALAGTHVKDKQGSPVTVMAGDLLEAIPEVLGM